MEVHHHPHSSPAIGGTPRKKWTHYFWEFLMLFLAVFCGFLAEYQLEHKIEKDRINQYMQGYIEDLVRDTTGLDLDIKYASSVSNGLDSLLDNLYDSDNAAKNTITLYRQSFSHMRIVFVGFNDYTATQLRNSGSFRLIRSKSLANAISEYWNYTVHILSLNEIFDRRANEIFTVGNHIFSSKYLIGSVLDTLTRLRSVIIDPAARLMTTDSNTLTSYANFIYRYKSGIENFYIKGLIDQRKRAVNLINLIKKEYHLK